MQAHRWPVACMQPFHCMQPLEWLHAWSETAWMERWLHTNHVSATLLEQNTWGELQTSSKYLLQRSELLRIVSN